MLATEMLIAGTCGTAPVDVVRDWDKGELARLVNQCRCRARKAADIDEFTACSTKLPAPG